jgi:hypothetical protein
MSTVDAPSLRTCHAGSCAIENPPALFVVRFKFKSFAAAAWRGMGSASEGFEPGRGVVG